ncbi:DUF3784 domain-containing protein [Bacillus sp. CGMCC 1.16541]|uniref:DUF3784 domain-containing protein n=1 Tax=Bacillus sp. CGMCC 1.16541 TaxID=2185143 RepID=UPI000D729731|nr:DUF3784 domain-containing protein [Bacillus sp. CGMCC 1.16541]
MAGAITNFIILIPFLVFAIMLLRGKGAFLIAGYNTKSAEEKAKYDEVALCKFMGKVMLGICVSIFLWGLSDVFHNQLLFMIGMVLFTGIIVFTLVYSNTGNRFRKEN